MILPDTIVSIEAREVNPIVMLISGIDGYFVIRQYNPKYRRMQRLALCEFSNN